MKILLLVGICVYATEAFIHFDREIGFVLETLKIDTNASSKSKRGNEIKIKQSVFSSIEPSFVRVYLCGCTCVCVCVCVRTPI
jgi:hypothetical protein